MTQHEPQNQMPPEMLAALLQTVRKRQSTGDAHGARAVLHALASQQPDDPRIWLALATAVETRAEQRAAIERALALDPHNQLALRALERFGDVEEAAEPDLSARIDAAEREDRPSAPPRFVPTMPPGS